MHKPDGKRSRRVQIAPRRMPALQQRRVVVATSHYPRAFRNAGRTLRDGSAYVANRTDRVRPAVHVTQTDRVRQQVHMCVDEPGDQGLPLAVDDPFRVQADAAQVLLTPYPRDHTASHGHRRRLGETVVKRDYVGVAQH